MGGKKLVTLLDLCVSSLRRGHANLLCIVPILTDDLRRVSVEQVGRKLAGERRRGMEPGCAGAEFLTRALLKSTLCLSFILVSEHGNDVRVVRVES